MAKRTLYRFPFVCDDAADLPTDLSSYVDGQDFVLKKNALRYVVSDNGTTKSLKQPMGVKPETTDAHFFVSINGDDSNDGLSPGSAFATVAAAKAALDATFSQRGHIHLLGGVHYAPSTGFVLSQWQSISGIGSSTVLSGANIPNGTNLAPAPPVLGLLGGYQQAKNLIISNVPEWGVGLRISIDAAHGHFSTENVRANNVFVFAMGQNSTAFGIGDDTTYDVADVVITGCRSEGRFDGTTTGVVFGAGSGNVLDITWLGGDHMGHAYHVIFNGGAACMSGCSFEFSSTADIWFYRNGLGSCVVSECRSENAQMFVVADNAYDTTVRECTVIYMQNTDGVGIQHRVGAAVRYVGRNRITGAHCPQRVVTLPATTSDCDFATILEVEGLSSEHTYPLTSPWARRDRVIRARDIRFLFDANGQQYPANQPARWMRRVNITVNGTNVLVWPKLYSVLKICLGADCGDVTLQSGTIGQVITLVFEQDGIGNRGYTPPAGVAWNNATPPTPNLNPKNCQSMDLCWNGTCWEEHTPVRNTVPVTPALNPVHDTFNGPDPSLAIGNGGAYWLGIPDTAGVYPWELVPGGGAMGIDSTVSPRVCATRCLGWVGDNNLDIAAEGAGLVGWGAAYVIETGSATWPVDGVKATFKFDTAMGIILNYVDDQNFMYVTLDTTFIAFGIVTRGVATLVNIVASGGPAAGSTHTLRVQRTATQVIVTLDPGGGQIQLTTNLSVNQQNLFWGTKHGILSLSRAVTFSSFSALS